MHAVVERARRARAEAAFERRSARLQTSQALRLRQVTRHQRETAIGAVWWARRLRFDRFGPVLAKWPGPSRPTAAVDELIHRLFSVTLSLSSCREHSSAAVLEDQISDVTDRIDGLIRDLRLLIFEGQQEAPEGQGQWDGSANLVLEQLASVADEVELLAQKYEGDGSVTMRLGEAAQGVRGAWVIARDGLIAPELG